MAAAEDDWKRTTGVFDRDAQATAKKKWKLSDTIRALPILDGFSSPERIQQISLNDLTIDYGGFRDVPRYDRCTTCHLGIDRAVFSREALEALTKKADDFKKDLDPLRVEKQAIVNEIKTLRDENKRLDDEIKETQN